MRSLGAEVVSLLSIGLLASLQKPAPEKLGMGVWATRKELLWGESGWNSIRLYVREVEVVGRVPIRQEQARNNVPLV